MSYLTVVCGLHRIRYPAAWQSCPQCPGSNVSLVNGQVHESTEVVL